MAFSHDLSSLFVGGKYGIMSLLVHDPTLLCLMSFRLAVCELVTSEKLKYSLKMGFKPDFTSYDKFADYINHLDSREERDKFAITLEKISTIDMPKELFQKHFFADHDFQTISQAKYLSTTREGNSFSNTVFGYCGELLRCKIVSRTPDNIFKGLDEIYVSEKALLTFPCTYTSKYNEWQWIAKYLGMRHAFFKVNEEKHCLHFYELCLKIDSANVKFKNLNCSNRELF